MNVTTPARVRKVVAFHSYKGGTGKTTFVANIGALYAEMGLRVCLLDFDLYAPSLSTYFQITPKFYLNDFLKGEADISDAIVDVSSKLGVKGQLLLGLSSPSSDDIHEIEFKDINWHVSALRRFWREGKGKLFSEYDLDYIFIDTTPGVKYWSINAILVSDALFLLLKISDMDIEGTKKMIKDTYEDLQRFGSQFYLILNKVPGAIPNQKSAFVDYEKSWEVELEHEIGTPVIGSVPCFCDIQFSRHEFLYTIKQPEHPFSQKLLDLAVKIQEVTRGTEYGDS